VTLAQLISSVRKRQFAPVYLLYGEESFFIEQAQRALEEHVLAGADASFNLDILYGPETSANQILNAARSFPTFAERRLVLVREAQRLKKDDQEKLVPYLDKAPPSTVLVLVHNDRKLPDQRLKFGKALKAHATLYEAKPLYENQVATWINEYAQEHQATVAPDAAHVLVAALGTNLRLIANELDKILLNLKAAEVKPAHVTRELVYEYVAIDRDYNVFELLNQIGARDIGKAHLTLDQMLKNPKENPSVVILGQLGTYFSKLAALKQQRIESEAGVAQALGLHPFVAKGYVAALRQFSYSQLTQAMHEVVQTDLALKGITTTRMPEGHLLKSLLYRVLQTSLQPA
jgi:DNA polymerase-3 subunit delta